MLDENLQAIWEFDHIVWEFDQWFHYILEP